MFSNVDKIDVGLMALGSLGSLIVGLSFPAMDLFFGRILNSLNSNSDFVEDINTLCSYLLIIAAFNIVAGYLQVCAILPDETHEKRSRPLSLQVYCWTYTGERQTQKFRERYVNAILAQEIGWFDDCGAGELSTRVTEVIGKIQDGSGRKIGDTLQYLTQVIGSYVLAFYLNWKLTLVMLASFPLIAGTGNTNKAPFFVGFDLLIGYTNHCSHLHDWGGDGGAEPVPRPVRRCGRSRHRDPRSHAHHFRAQRPARRDHQVPRVPLRRHECEDIVPSYPLMHCWAILLMTMFSLILTDWYQERLEGGLRQRTHLRRVLPHLRAGLLVQRQADR